MLPPLPVTLGRPQTSFSCSRKLLPPSAAALADGCPNPSAALAGGCVVPGKGLGGLEGLCSSTATETLQLYACVALLQTCLEGKDRDCCRGRMLAGVGVGTHPLPTCCESPRPTRHGPRHLPGVALDVALDQATPALVPEPAGRVGNPRAPSKREAGAEVRGHGQCLRRDSPQRWLPSTPRKTSAAVQQGSQLRQLASPAG